MPEIIDSGYLQQRALLTLEEQRKLLALKSKPQVDPKPGDGVCPTSQQYGVTLARAHRFWQILTRCAPHIPKVPRAAEQLIDLLKDVPAFPVTLSHRFSTGGSYCLHTECISEWMTSTDPDCSQRFKTVRHSQTLGIARPVVYQLVDTEGVQAVSQIDDDQPVFLLLVFAWSYIISSRWVEALQSTGANAQLLQGVEVTAQNFWSLVRNQQWRAILNHDDKSYFAPWSLAPPGEKHRHKDSLFQNNANSNTNYGCSDLMAPASPATSFALEMLAGFCTTNEIYEQSVVALVVVMNLPARAYKQKVSIAKFGPPINNSFKEFRDFRPSFGLTLSHLDKCITLSCCPEGMDSLLCGTFFDPGVPCNLIGAHMTGVLQALSPIKGDSTILLNVLTRKCPRLAPLWAAAVCIQHIKHIFDQSCGGTPPLALPAASWTGLVESFIQVRYSSVTLQAEERLRAQEWQIKYLTTEERLPPHAPSPPFGKTAVCNLDIDVRGHLHHGHALLSYQMYWILESGAKFPAQAAPIHLRSITADLKIAKPEPSHETDGPIDNMYNGSCDATLNMFYWYQNLDEGGLWLRSGSDSSSTARAIGRHLWIADDDDDDEEESLCEERISKDSEQQEQDLARIREWLVYVKSGEEDEGEGC